MLCRSNTVTAIMWIVLTPVPILLCLIPLAKRTLPYKAQLACLQGEVGLNHLEAMNYSSCLWQYDRGVRRGWVGRAVLFSFVRVLGFIVV